MDSKCWTTLRGFSPQGYPLLYRETETVELSNFTENFIAYLADVLANFEPDPDPSARYREFREIYVECLLDFKHEYGNNAELSP